MNKKLKLLILITMSLVFLTTIFSSTIYSFTNNTSVTNVQHLNDLTIIHVNSNTDVQEYQIIISTINGSINTYFLDGFMEDSIKLSVPQKTVFFNLITSGTSGNITLIFSGCITISRINMLSETGEKISNSGLPKTLCSD